MDSENSSNGLYSRAKISTLCPGVYVRGKCKDKWWLLDILQDDVISREGENIPMEYSNLISI